LQPLDVTKTRLQLGGPNTQSVGALCTHMFKVEGVSAFYKGLEPFVMHLVTKYACRWYFNEFFRGLCSSSGVSLLAEEGGNVTIFGGFLAGFGSGITEAILIVTPFEVIKTRLQQQTGTDKSKMKYKGLTHCAKTIVEEEGASALWKGNVACMARQGINQLMLFGCYPIMKKQIYGLEREQKTEFHQSIILGTAAGAIGPLFNNPLDVCKTRMMAQKTVPGKSLKYTGVIQCISTIAREEGAAALMRGVWLRIARLAPGMGITFTTVEKFNEHFGDAF